MEFLDEDGYCYLQLFDSTVGQEVVRKLGSWPTCLELLMCDEKRSCDVWADSSIACRVVGYRCHVGGFDSAKDVMGSDGWCYAADFFLAQARGYKDLGFQYPEGSFGRALLQEEWESAREFVLMVHVGGNVDPGRWPVYSELCVSDRDAYFEYLRNHRLALLDRFVSRGITEVDAVGLEKRLLGESSNRPLLDSCGDVEPVEASCDEVVEPIAECSEGLGVNTLRNRQWRLERKQRKQKKRKTISDG